jgi:C-terminal domain on Strawberry notch homologue
MTCLQVQQLGRTHRSNQRQPPLYLIVASDICGEQRFASAGTTHTPCLLLERSVVHLQPRAQCQNGSGIPKLHHIASLRL